MLLEHAATEHIQNLFNLCCQFDPTVHAAALLFCLFWLELGRGEEVTKPLLTCAQINFRKGNVQCVI